MNKKWIYLVTLLVFLIAPLSLLAADYGLTESANAAKLPANVNLMGMVAKVVGTALSLVGVIFLVLFIYGGMLWMTAGGKADNTKKAKDLMVNAVIGLVLIFSAYFVTRFVVSELTSASQVTPGGNTRPGTSFIGEDLNKI
jgi:hypothetical protein